MVTKCANPSCENPFRYLRKGKLFLLEKPPITLISVLSPPEAEFRQSAPRGEYFWLCDECAQNMTVTSDGHGGVLIATHK